MVKFDNLKEENEQAFKIIIFTYRKKVKCGTTPGKAIFIIGKGYIGCYVYLHVKQFLLKINSLHLPDLRVH